MVNHRIIHDYPLPQHIVDICIKHMVNLEEFVQELREAGINPSIQKGDPGLNSMMIVVAGTPLWIGQPEYSEYIKSKLDKLKKIEELMEH